MTVMWCDMMSGFTEIQTLKSGTYLMGSISFTLILHIDLFMLGLLGVCSVQ